MFNRRWQLRRNTGMNLHPRNRKRRMLAEQCVHGLGTARVSVTHPGGWWPAFLFLGLIGSAAFSKRMVWLLPWPASKPVLHDVTAPLTPPA
jgi:hypothetical protein